MTQSRPLDGVRVLELASWVFVPSACAVLAEWGADVIKVENPDGGDPQRGLVSSGFGPPGTATNFLYEVPNRGKRSIAVDLKHPAGRDLVLELAKTCDVVATNLLPQQRASLKLDVSDIEQVNPSVVYAIGSGVGEVGPEAGRGGFDLPTYWARTLAHPATPEGLPYPVNMPAPAFGDLSAGLALAGGIALGLLQQARTGTSVVVDNSLIGMAAWSSAMSLVGTAVTGIEGRTQWNHLDAPNPLVNYYRTSDGRFIHLNMLQPDRWWPDLVGALGRPELVEDPRWRDRERGRPAPEIVALLDEIFASKTLAEWSEALGTLTGGAVWEPVRIGSEVLEDEQLRATGAIRELGTPGAEFPIISAPVQIEGQRPDSRAMAPGLGEHTDEVLTEMGLSMDQIIELKLNGALL